METERDTFLEEKTSLIEQADKMKQEHEINVNEIKERLDEENRLIKQELEEHKSRSEQLNKDLEELRETSTAKDQADSMLEGIKKQLLS